MEAKGFEVQTKIENEEDNHQNAIVEVKISKKRAIKEEKNIAFKSSKSGKQEKFYNDSDESSDEENALMTQGF